MDKITQLWIRAAKTGKYERLESITRRFYHVKNNKGLILQELMTIVDVFCPLPISKLYNNLNKPWYEELSLEDKFLSALLHEIRCTKASDFEGLSTPLRFNRK